MPERGKRCKKCGLLKDATDFYAGRNECKECAKAYARANCPRYRREHRKQMAAYKRQWSALNPEGIREIMRRYKTRHRDAILGYQDKWKKEYPERYSAHQAVTRALRRGDLRRPSSCSWCGVTKIIQATHSDYSKPLDVEWLCVKCHRLKDRMAANVTC